MLRLGIRVNIKRIIGHAATWSVGYTLDFKWGMKLFSTYLIMKQLN